MRVKVMKEFQCNRFNGSCGPLLSFHFCRSAVVAARGPGPSISPPFLNFAEICSKFLEKIIGSREPGKWVITNQSAAAARFHTGHALPEFSALTILFREDNIHPLQLNHPK